MADLIPYLFISAFIFAIFYFLFSLKTGGREVYLKNKKLKKLKKKRKREEFKSKVFQWEKLSNIYYYNHVTLM